MKNIFIRLWLMKKNSEDILKVLSDYAWVDPITYTGFESIPSKLIVLQLFFSLVVSYSRMLIVLQLFFSLVVSYSRMLTRRKIVLQLFFRVHFSRDC